MNALIRRPLFDDDLIIPTRLPAIPTVSRVEIPEIPDVSIVHDLCENIRLRMALRRDESEVESTNEVSDGKLFGYRRYYRVTCRGR